MTSMPSPTITTQQQMQYAAVAQCPQNFTQQNPIPSYRSIGYPQYVPVQAVPVLPQTTGVPGSTTSQQHGAIGTPIIAFPSQTQDVRACLLYTSPSPRDRQKSRMPSSA